MMRLLTIERTAAVAILLDCQARYPEEACGMLIGEDDADGNRKIVEARAMTNVAPVFERRRRFKLDPAEQLAAEREAAGRDLSVVGFYHSHPDAQAVPSETDAAEAWPFYSYVIVPVQSDGTGRMRSWAFDDGRRQFDEESIVDLDI